MANDPAFRSARREGVRPRKKKKGAIIGVLLLCALPVAAAIVVALLPTEKQQAMLSKLPEGAGRWGIAALVAFATMALLAWVVLPILHRASGWLRGLGRPYFERGVVGRVLFAPVQVLLEAVWLFFQALFAIDAFLIILAAFLGLLFILRVMDPTILPGVMSDLGS